MSHDPYSALYTKDPGTAINVTDTEHFNDPEIKQAWQRAAHSEEGVSQHTVDLLTGGMQSTLIRSTPVEGINPKFQKDFHDIADLLQKKARSGLTAEETAQLDADVKHLSSETHINEAELNSRVAQAGQYLTVKEQQTPNLSALGTHRPTNEEKKAEQDIVATLKKRVRGGELSPEENAQLEKNLETWRAERGYSAEKAQQTVQDYETVLKRYDEANKSDAVTGLIGGANFGEAAEKTVVVPRYSAQNLTAEVGFKPDDLPPKAPPYTKEQQEIIDTLHETGHYMQFNGKSTLFDDQKLGDEYKEQAREIGADKNVVDFLNAQHDSKAKEYWLESRNVSSFAFPPEENFAHDTATFLRVQEKTGQTLDLEKFRAEKQGLLQKVEDKFGSKDIAEKAKTADIMGAMDDVLHDPNAKLTDVQKAEAERYLKDAKALGYKTNHHYEHSAAKETQQHAQARDSLGITPEQQAHIENARQMMGGHPMADAHTPSAPITPAPSREPQQATQSV